MEFGSGLSTHVLASTSVREGLTCRIASLDHDPQHGLFGEKKSLTFEPPVSATTVLAPLVARDFGGNLVPAYYYSPAAVNPFIPADIIVVDGPPETLGGRKGTLFQAMDLARRGTLLLLDDAHRPNERNAISEWQHYFGDAIEVRLLPGFRRGLAAILIRNPISSCLLLEHHCWLLWREIREVIPETSRFALVDDNYLANVATEGDHRVARWRQLQDSYADSSVDDEFLMKFVQNACEDGAEFVVIAWPAYWRLEQHPEFVKYLRSQFLLLRENARLVIFRSRNL